jgi:hypothetical protein
MSFGMGHFGAGATGATCGCAVAKYPILCAKIAAYGCAGTVSLGVPLFIGLLAFSVLRPENDRERWPDRALAWIMRRIKKL